VLGAPLLTTTPAFVFKDADIAAGIVDFSSILWDITDLKFGFTHKIPLLMLIIARPGEI